MKHIKFLHLYTLNFNLEGESGKCDKFWCTRVFDFM